MNFLLNTAASSGETSISGAVTLIFAVLVIIGAVKGLTRGIKRQVVRIITIAASIFVAIYLTGNVSDAINADLTGMTVGDLMASADLSQLGAAEELITNIDARVFSLLAVVPMAVILLPVIFTVSFVLISIVGEIVHIILSMLLGFKKSRNNLITRVIGMVFGALQGAVVAGIILFPIGCYANLADGMATAMKDGGIKEGSSIEELCELIETDLKDAKDNAVISTTMKLAGNALQEKFSTVKLDGKDVDAREYFFTVMGAVGDFSYLDETDFKAPTAEEKTVINGIKDKFTKDDYLAEVLSGLLREAAIAIDEERLEIDMEEPYRGMLLEAIAIFKTSNEENLDSDVTTLLDVYYTLADNGVLTAMADDPDSVTDALAKETQSGDTVIMSIIGILKTNERTKPLVNMLAKLSVSIMAEQLGVDGDVAETYDNLKEGINDVLTIDKNLSDKEYKAEVSETLDSVLAENGISLDDNIVDGMADYVTKNLKENDQLTEENIDDILFSYYDAYLKSQQGQ